MVLTALGLVAFLGFASLVIDLGRLYVVRNELQNTADAAALAGAAHLIRDENGVAVRDSTLASQKILEVAQRQSELLGFTPVAPEDRNDLTISFGHWNIYANNPETAWTDMGTSVGPNSTANGVRVIIRRGSGLAFGPVTTFLAAVLGYPT
ncbi:MAG: Tad domain-containing protein, partial [Syntrophobacterales bacterium]|nr:Tad domain-containing protein [Syntrophobacterales bacterium]